MTVSLVNIDVRQLIELRQEYEMARQTLIDRYVQIYLETQPDYASFDAYLWIAVADGPIILDILDAIARVAG